MLSALLALPGHAAPRVPTDATEVLERLPARATDPALRQARQALARAPRDEAAALALVDRLLQAFAADSDPRHLGQAQAALAPWWGEAAPPPAIRVQRAVLRQYGHAFDAARADLEAVALPSDTDRRPPPRVDRSAASARPTVAPGLPPSPTAARLTTAVQAEAWSWLAAIAMVQARYADARRACDGYAPMAPIAVAAACRAAADALAGQADAAARALRQALATDREADPAQRLWAWTRLAEIERQRGDEPAAEQAFAQALALQRTDSYLLAARADQLLDLGRPAEVLVLLREHTRNDLLLLRLVLAAQALAAQRAPGAPPEARAWRQALDERFEAARTRGDATHDKEAARLALLPPRDTARALALARANWAVQREPADARVLLEAAWAAQDPAAAQPVLQWLGQLPGRHALLDPLARQLAGLSTRTSAATAPSGASR